MAYGDWVTLREALSSTYHYQAEDHGFRRGVGWSIRLYRKDAVAVEVSLEEAEKVLAEWGIKRLDYEFPPKN